MRASFGSENGSGVILPAPEVWGQERAARRVLATEPLASLQPRSARYSSAANTSDVGPSTCPDRVPLDDAILGVAAANEKGMSAALRAPEQHEPGDADPDTKWREGRGSPLRPVGHGTYSGLARDRRAH